EHDLSSVPQEQVLAELESWLREADVAAIPNEQPETDLPTNPVSDACAKNGARSRGNDNEPDVQDVTGSGKHGCGDQRRFAGQRETHAFKCDRAEDRPVAVGRDQFSYIALREERHVQSHVVLCGPLPEVW